MYNAVGIDVSKGKSTVAVLQPGGVIVRKPFDVTHSSHDLNQLISYISSLDGDTRVVMECTGRYHEPMANALSDAGLFSPTVSFDDGGLELNTFELWDVKGDVARRSRKVSIIMAGTVSLALSRALVLISPDQLISLMIQQSVECLLNTVSDQILKIVLYEIFV